MTREALIEAMARAIHAAFQEGRGSPHPYPPAGFDKQWRKEATAALSAIEAAGAVAVETRTLVSLANACESGQVADKDVVGRLRRLAANPYRSTP